MHFFFKAISFSLLILLSCRGTAAGEIFPKGEKRKHTIAFYPDTTHRLNFRYPDKKRGIKPFIAPALLIGSGVVVHTSPKLKHNFQDWMQSTWSYSGDADDYLQFVPLVSVYAFNLAGLHGKDNFGNLTAITIKSILLNDLIVNNLKNWTHTTRPNGTPRSFPSGHTSFSFATAHILHKEFGEISPWFSIGAYGCASAVGIMRIAKNAHWLSDVLAGAGIGMLSTELIYLTHQYKWDNKHLRNFDIFPFRLGKQKGLALRISF